MDSVYNASFFERMDEWAERSASVMVPLVQHLLSPASVLDVGGGTGAWGATFARLGVSDYTCADGSYVDRSRLRIPSERFREADLAQPLDLGRRFDLALCLEVGEHLPPAAAQTLVDSLTRHSDVVLFSAAIPLQSGTNHINEQWPAFWSNHFRSADYNCVDCVRPRVWNDPGVGWWYKQNTLLFIKGDPRQPQYARLLEQPDTSQVPASLVHPELYLGRMEMLNRIESHEQTFGVRWSLQALLKSAHRSLMKQASRPGERANR